MQAFSSALFSARQPQFFPSKAESTQANLSTEIRSTANLRERRNYQVVKKKEKAKPKNGVKNLASSSTYFTLRKDRAEHSM